MWVWVAALVALLVLSLVVPGLIQRRVQSTGRQPEPQGDGTYAFRGTLARPAAGTDAARRKRRGRLVVERVALRWEPRRGAPKVIPFKGMTVVGLLGQRELGAELPSEQVRLRVVDATGEILDVCVDACERPTKTERPWPSVRGTRYTAWLRDHLLDTRIVTEFVPETEGP